MDNVVKFCLTVTKVLESYITRQFPIDSVPHEARSKSYHTYYTHDVDTKLYFILCVYIQRI